MSPPSPPPYRLLRPLAASRLRREVSGYAPWCDGCAGAARPQPAASAGSSRLPGGDAAAATVVPPPGAVRCAAAATEPPLSLLLLLLPLPLPVAPPYAGAAPAYARDASESDDSGSRLGLPEPALPSPSALPLTPLPPLPPLPPPPPLPLPLPPCTAYDSPLLRTLPSEPELPAAATVVADGAASVTMLPPDVAEGCAPPPDLRAAVGE
jgi:hypothetical protein